MNLVDVIIVAALLGGFLAGFRQGFIVEVAGILGAFVALALAKAWYPAVRAWLEAVAPHSSWLTVIAYLAVFLVVWAAILRLARLVRRGARLFLLGGLDRLGGGLIGLIQGALLIEVLLYLGKRVPSAQMHRAIAHSTLAPGFLHAIPYLQRLLPHVPHG